MGVVFTVGDDTNDLLVPFIQERNKRISKENINEIYLRVRLGQITSCQFWQEGKSDFEPDAHIAHFNELEHAVKKICQRIISADGYRPG